MASAQFVNPSSFNYQNTSPTGPGNAVQDFFTGSSTVNNAYNWDAMNYQDKFQEYMANTQYQRGVQDMLNAGINPMVATAQNLGSAKAYAPSGASSAPASANFSNGMLGKGLASMVKGFSQGLGLSSLTGSAKLLSGLI